MDLSNELKINKLKLLFFLDKMDVPLTDSIILEICYYHTSWIAYLDCTQSLIQMLEDGLIHCTKRENVNYYSITPDGRKCLALFYTQIPSSIRTEITEYVRENRMHFRRRQEYCASYKKNSDGTYTALLKIVDPTQTTLDLKLIVPNKETAKLTAENWKNRAAKVFTLLYEQIVEQ